jgi:hypothetical protein
MTYKFTLIVPDSEPIIEEGDMGSFNDLLLRIKREFARFMFTNSDINWSKASIEFIQE